MICNLDYLLLVVAVASSLVFHDQNSPGTLPDMSEIDKDRARREARRAKILAGGNDRLTKITGVYNTGSTTSEGENVASASKTTTLGKDVDNANPIGTYCNLVVNGWRLSCVETLWGPAS